MDWIEDLEMRENSIRKRLEFDNHCRLFEPLDLQKYQNDIEKYEHIVETQCASVDRYEETALRYRLRLQFPLLHHLRGLAHSALPKKSA